MAKTTQAARIAALEATVSGQVKTIEHLRERVERLTGRIERVKRWSHQQDSAIGEMPERAARYLRATHDRDCLHRAVDAGHVPTPYAL